MYSQSIMLTVGMCVVRTSNISSTKSLMRSPDGTSMASTVTQFPESHDTYDNNINTVQGVFKLCLYIYTYTGTYMYNDITY